MRPAPDSCRDEVQVDAGGAAGSLVVPDGARGLVLFAHGSGSSRLSPRNRYVAGVLADAGLATLLVDLLTQEEERRDVRTRELRFDVELLAGRLRRRSRLGGVRTSAPAVCRSACSGRHTGAGAALVAAARRAGGRARGRVPGRAPGPGRVGPRRGAGADAARRRRAGRARARPQPAGARGDDARAAVELEVVGGATHLFEERGALERVADLARGWFDRYLRAESEALTRRP